MQDEKQFCEASELKGWGTVAEVTQVAYCNLDCLTSSVYAVV